MVKPKFNVTRSKDRVWLIGYPSNKICGARLPSGRDVMKNFVYHHLALKLPIRESSQLVFNEIIQFWEKSRLPIRPKQHIIKKIKNFYHEHTNLIKNRKRSNASDQVKQKRYSEKLEKLFDISHANTDALIRNDEDRAFLKLQKESRTGTIGSVDLKLAAREKRAEKRRSQHVRSHQRTITESLQKNLIAALTNDEDESCTEDDKNKEDTDYNSNINTPHNTHSSKKRKILVSPKVAAVLDRTNISVRKSTMVIASVVNEAGCSASSAVLSKSTVHRQRRRRRQEAAEKIKANHCGSKCVIHWDGKLLPDVTSGETGNVDRLPVLTSSLVDGSIKLLGVPKLASGTGQASADAILEQLRSWQSDTFAIGMCFDTTAANTGRFKGACSLLESAVGRNLLWLACRHHMLEVLLADVFGACFGPSNGPDIQMFKRFRDNWSKLECHESKLSQVPLVPTTDAVKSFISEQLQVKHTREDYSEFLHLASLMVGLNLDKKIRIRKPGALHRARWMAKAIYSMKMELLLDGNEADLHLTAHELQGIRRFNRFVITVYIQSWFTCRSAADAPINDILLIQRLSAYDDKMISKIGLKMMVRHSWYLSPELATLSLFSHLLSSDEKEHLILNMEEQRGPHLIKSLPQSISGLHISRTFFRTAGIDDSFLQAPIKTWAELDSFKVAASLVKKVNCVNDCAERGVALIQQFNATTKDEEQKQYLLQVVEKHRKEFKKLNRCELFKM